MAAIECEEVERGPCCKGVVSLAEGVIDTEGNQGRLPALQYSVGRTGQEGETLMRIYHARHVLGALEITRHPVEVVGGAA